jgi:hypothetical protein
MFRIRRFGEQSQQSAVFRRDIAHASPFALGHRLENLQDSPFFVVLGDR